MRVVADEEELDQILMSDDNYGKLVVLDFFAEWCGPCKRVAPQFAELAARHQRVARFAKVDVDAAPDLAQNAGVRAMPTFHIYKAGERVFEDLLKRLIVDNQHLATVELAPDATLAEKQKAEEEAKLAAAKSQTGEL